MMAYPVEYGNLWFIDIVVCFQSSAVYAGVNIILRQECPDGLDTSLLCREVYYT